MTIQKLGDWDLFQTKTFRGSEKVKVSEKRRKMVKKYLKTRVSEKT